MIINIYFILSDLEYLLVVGFSVTVTCTGICKSPVAHEYQPLLFVVSPLIVTVKTPGTLVVMVTVVPSIDPLVPVTQFLPSLQNLFSPAFLFLQLMFTLCPLNPLIS